MPSLRFTHDSVLTEKGNPWALNISAGPNDIEWGYNLNTVTYPTYGGQVVQILSVYVDDITITGNVGSYHSMETIYRWFARYMAAATSGYQTSKGGRIEAYNQIPVVMSYPERGWTFKIYPKSMPGFMYSTDTVAPQWTITAAVAQSDPELEDSIKTLSEFNSIVEDGQFLGKSGIGNNQGKQLLDALTKNLAPKLIIKDGQFVSTGAFSDPNADPNTSDYKDQLGDYYHGLVDVYLDGDDIDIVKARDDASKPYLNAQGTANLDSTVTKKSTKSGK